MRTVIAILVAVVLAAGATYAYVRKNARRDLVAALAERESAWQKEKDALEASLAEMRSRPGSVRLLSASQPAAVGGSSESAREIIDQLKGIRANSRDKSIRKVVYHLESLAELGPQALPDIKAFLDEFQDVDYMGVRPEEERPVETAEAGASGRGGRGERGERFGRSENDRGGQDPRERFRGLFGRNEVRLNFSLPPSLRMGMVDVLAQIGGAEAEEILSTMLAETGRAVEVAYVAKTLQEIAPNKYRDIAITSAKDLLLNPMQNNQGDRLDENSKDYLYWVLTTFGDTSFGPAAQGMLVTAEGRIDSRALAYLNSTLKEQAMPSIYSAFNDPRITNQFDKAPLMQMALNYVGPNQQANEMLGSIVTNDQIPGELRSMAILGLTRGEPTKETLQARVQVVEALRASTGDERVQRSLQFAQNNIQRMIAGQPAEDWRSMFQRPGSDGGGEGGRRTGRGGPGRQTESRVR